MNELTWRTKAAFRGALLIPILVIVIGSAFYLLLYNANMIPFSTVRNANPDSLKSTLLFLLWGLVEGVIYSYILVSLFSTWMIWMEVVGFSRSEYYRYSREMMTFTLRSRTGRQVTYRVAGACIILLVLILIGSTNSFRYLLCFVVFIPVWVIGHLVYMTKPPTILLLGCSSQQLNNTHMDLKISMNGLRVVSLVDATKAESASVFSFLLGDSLRTTDNKWQEVVHQLMEIVPIIVIDTRIASPAIIYEASYVMRTGLIYKTVFLSESNGESPVLDSLISKGVSLSPELAKPLPIFDVIRLLVFATNADERLPSKDNPIVQIVFQWRQSVPGLMQERNKRNNEE